jgi:hypothetical protein
MEAVCILLTRPETLEADVTSSARDDWNEDVYGEIDTKENRKKYPHGFMWECCEQRTGAKGCQQGPHQSKTSQKMLKVKGWDAETDVYYSAV